MHKHDWKQFRLDAIGYWEKRNCPGDGVYFNGHAEFCVTEGCPLMRFVCDDPRFRIVEVEKP
jgi:hypothetical protein